LRKKILTTDKRRNTRGITQPVKTPPVGDRPGAHFTIGSM
jgi:hypothetical protein